MSEREETDLLKLREHMTDENKEKLDTLLMLTGGKMHVDYDESEAKNTILVMTIGDDERVWAVEKDMDAAIDHAYGLIERAALRSITDMGVIL